jgi:uncharacterized protein YndB with AHSA1/START domain
METHTPLDIGRYIGAVTRTVSSRDEQGRTARRVVAARTYDTTQEDLWDCVTNQDRLPRWFAPVTGDLRLGGRYQVQGNAGGEILECEAPRHYKISWEYGGNTSWVNITIDQVAADVARLTLEHVSHETDEQWKQFGPGAAGVGWELGFYGLARHISTRSSVAGDEGMQWMMSEEGKAFMRQSSDAWAEAAIAGGADPTAAREAAARVTAAFTAS